MADLDPADSSSDNCTEMQIAVQEVVNCALPNWYHKFKEITFKSIFIPLSDEFVHYLNSDGCVFPKGCELPALVGGATHDSSFHDDDWETANDQVCSDDDSPEDEIELPSFPELICQISSAISSLSSTGEGVLPKLNWSAPRDATWIVPTNSMRSTCPAEVILLLKSSDFISHDLSRISEYSGEAVGSSGRPLLCTLCLRRWMPIVPSAEFRCFVFHNQLIGISQRNSTAHYSFLMVHKEETKHDIKTFFKRHIQQRFSNENFVMDICKTNEGDYLVVDFNPFCPLTDPLLYSWEELSDLSMNCGHILELPELRLVDSNSIQPSDLQTCRLPKDVVDLSSGEDIHKFVDLFKNHELPGQLQNLN